MFFRKQIIQKVDILGKPHTKSQQKIKSTVQKFGRCF